MGTVIVWQTLSVDGYSAGLNTSMEHWLGERGELLHDWMFSPVDNANKAADCALW